MAEPSERGRMELALLRSSWVPLLLDGLTEQHGFAPFVEALSADIGCAAGLTTQVVPPAESRQFWAGLPQELGPEHAVSPLWEDPWELGAIALQSPLVPHEHLEKTAFCRAICRPRKLHPRVVRVGEPSAFVALALLEPDERESDARPVLDALVPHLSRVARLMGLLRKATPTPSVQPATQVDPLLLSHPVFWVDDDRNVLAHNPAAKRLLREDGALETHDGQLWAGRTHTAQLARLVASTEPNMPRALRLMDAEGAEQLVVMTAHPNGVGSLVHVLDRGLKWLPPAELLEQLFQLTPAESRVALGVASGKAPRALAEELDISVNTARVHVQRVLSKTSSPRQADLASLLVQLGALTELSRARPPLQAPGSSADSTE